MDIKKISFIGCGNMGEAILKGLLESSLLKKEQVIFLEKDPARRDYIKEIYDISSVDNIHDCTEDSQYLLLAVKPQNISGLLTDLKKCFRKDRNHIISIIAGISTAYYEKALGEGASVIRVMPNTPALYKRGMITISPGKYVGENDLAFVTGLMEMVGRCMIINEDFQHISTAINGSGPAYFFLFCRALMKAAVSGGMNAETARELIAGTMSGAAEMIERSGSDDMDKLIARVASPGGTTEKALETFECNGFEGIIKKAVKNAVKRSEELEKEII